jgi:hypothetical protein
MNTEVWITNQLVIGNGRDLSARINEFYQEQEVGGRDLETTTEKPTRSEPRPPQPRPPQHTERVTWAECQGVYVSRIDIF